MPKVGSHLQVIELQTELVRAASNSNEAVQNLEQTMALLTADRAAAEDAAGLAKQAELAVRVQLQQAQGELAAMASEREWAQDSTEALQVRHQSVSILKWMYC